MTPFFRKLLHAGTWTAGVLEGLLEHVERLFLSKAEATRRATGRCETLKREELEEERLDRLRNPGNYRGR